MEIRKLISNFVANIFENNFAEADKNLKQIVEAKVTGKIRKTSKMVEEKAKGKKPDFLDVDDDGDKDEPMEDAAKSSKGKGGKLSKEENKERFLKMIASKKGKKKKKFQKGK